MQAVEFIAYRYLTDNEYFVMYKPPGTEVSGGGQRYIDFPTSAVSVARWRRFFAGVAGVQETVGTHGPHWDFPVHSLGVKEASSPAQATLYQRRETTVALSNQNINANRLPAWLPETGFPSPGPDQTGAVAPTGLAVFLVRTSEGQVWAGWSLRDHPEQLSSTKTGRDLLHPLLDPDNEAGSAGFIQFNGDDLYLLDDSRQYPAFIAGSEVEGANAGRVVISRLSVAGFKSIGNAFVDLAKINVLIGANSAGKSNFLSAISMLVRNLGDDLKEVVEGQGGANSILFNGAKQTQEIEFHVGCTYAGRNLALHQRLSFTPPDGLSFASDHLRSAASTPADRVVPVGSGCLITGSSLTQAIARGVVEAFRSGVVTYHFADTSRASSIRLGAYIEDSVRLSVDGANLPAVLMSYQKTHRSTYERIVRTVRKLIPGFADFILEPQSSDNNRVLLNWRRERHDYLLGPHQFSDGALRAIALVTLLLQPERTFPSALIIDEPELGLHPYALSVVAGLIRSAATSSQVIVATQSQAFLDNFDPADVVVVEAEDGTTRFRRLNTGDMEKWLDEYSLGELWQRNILGGGPLP